MKTKKTQILPYGTILEVYKDLPAELKKTMSGNDSLLGLTWKDDKDDTLVNVWISCRLFENSKDKKLQKFTDQTRQQIIVHECVHIKQFVEEAIESKLDNETEAYLVSWLQFQVGILAAELNKTR